jgi:Fe-S-cluster containining protein
MPNDVDFSSLKEIERLSRAGEHGEWRRDFDRRFRSMLDGMYAEIQKQVREYSSQAGSPVSCGKGCTECCRHFVTIPVSQAIVIADYLSANEDAMAGFKRGYARWRAAIEDNPEALALVAQMETFSTMCGEVEAVPQDLLSAYHRFGIPCPFLDGKKCSIYAVRPICCAAYFAVSPPEFCLVGSDMPATIFEVAPSQDELRRMSQLTDPRLSWHQEPMPDIVYKILTRGLPEVAEAVFRIFGEEEKAMSRQQGGKP